MRFNNAPRDRKPQLRGYHRRYPLLKLPWWSWSVRSRSLSISFALINTSNNSSRVSEEKSSEKCLFPNHAFVFSGHKKSSFLMFGTNPNLSRRSFGLFSVTHSVYLQNRFALDKLSRCQKRWFNKVFGGNGWEYRQSSLYSAAYSTMEALLPWLISVRPSASLQSLTPPPRRVLLPPWCQKK
jgi:hypothetical protein